MQIFLKKYILWTIFGLKMNIQFEKLYENCKGWYNKPTHGCYVSNNFGLNALCSVYYVWTKVSFPLRKSKVKYERRPNIMANVDGLWFQNLTNCTITLSIFDPSIVTNMLYNLQGLALDVYLYICNIIPTCLNFLTLRLRLTFCNNFIWYIYQCWSLWTNLFTFLFVDNKTFGFDILFCCFDFDLGLNFLNKSF